MGRRFLAMLLLWLLLGIGLMTPAGTRAQSTPTPVILIHGQGGTPDLTWKTAVASLEERGYKLGESLFAVDLSGTRASYRRLGVLDDAQVVLNEVHRVLEATGAKRVDLVGHSRGGLIARLLATGPTANLVRRVVTINTPHEGALSAEQIQALLASSGVKMKRPVEVQVPEDLQAGSLALAALSARAARYGDRTAPALAIASTWREGLPADLTGHDGAVPVASQLAWPGAQTALFRLGPGPEELQAILQSDLAAGLLVLKSPHLQSLDSPEVLGQVVAFLQARLVSPPLRPCEPACRDFAGLVGHPAAGEIRPRLGNPVPYDLGPMGERRFEPDQPMTRAEFVAGLAQALGLEERFRAPASADLEGHWAAGWVEAARDAGLVGQAEAFGPDEPMPGAEAAAMILLAGGRPGPNVALEGPLTMADGALLLVRAFR